MRLDCCIDNCPITGKPVSMFDCCGSVKKKRKCHYYPKKPWSEQGVVECHHPDAKRLRVSQRDARRLGKISNKSMEVILDQIRKKEI